MEEDNLSFISMSESEEKPLIETCFLCGLEGCFAESMLEISKLTELFPLSFFDIYKSNTCCPSCMLSVCRIKDLQEESCGLNKQLNFIACNIKTRLRAASEEDAFGETGTETASQIHSERHPENSSDQLPASSNLVSNVTADNLPDAEKCLFPALDDIVFHYDESLAFKQEYPFGRALWSIIKGTKATFRRKRRRNSLLKQFKCYFCEQILSSKYTLEVHLRIHTKEEAHKCQICEKACPSAYNLQVHVTMVHGSEQEKRELLSRTTKKTQPMKCYFCNVFICSYYDLQQHIRHIHIKEVLPQKCENCCKSVFYIRSHRRNCHMATDEGRKRKFQYYAKRVEKNKLATNCYFCQKQLTRKDGIELHMRAHTKEGVVGECKKCQKLFYTRKVFARHVLLTCRTVKDEQKLAEEIEKRNTRQAREKERQVGICHKCGKWYKTLRRHVPTCGVKLEDKKTCLVCDVSFETLWDKQLHDLQVHEKQKPFTCYFCHKQFVHRHPLEKHVFCHTKEKSHACLVLNCCQRFSVRTAMVTHMRLVHGADKEGRQGNESLAEIKTSYNSIRQRLRKNLVFKCKNCPRKFAKEKNLHGHQAVCE